jgi:hypothetical protein
MSGLAQLSLRLANWRFLMHKFVHFPRPIAALRKPKKQAQSRTKIYSRVFVRDPSQTKILH